ncbi:MAG: hypothetical protein C0467_17595 [Planctomycetaceae bacterium]|nr:hypothetical protein [Planctomycetaceae bacterium]
MLKWRELPPAVRAVSLHESGHATTAELLGWKVRSLELHADGGGVCWLSGAPPAPWVDLVVSAAGHAAEMHYRGRVRGGGSWTDRAEAAAVVEQTGVEAWECPEAVLELEERLWPVLELDSVRQAIVRVSRELARMRCLTRRMFVALAEPALNDETRREVRRFCRRTVLEVVER